MSHGVRFSTHTASDGREPCRRGWFELSAVAKPFHFRNANVGATTVSDRVKRDKDAQKNPPRCAVSFAQLLSASVLTSIAVVAFVGCGGGWNDAHSSAPIGFVPIGARPHRKSSHRPCVNESSASANRVARAICAIAFGNFSKCRLASGALCRKCATNTVLPSGKGLTSASSSKVSTGLECGVDPWATTADDPSSATARNTARDIEIARAREPRERIATRSPTARAKETEQARGREKCR